MAEEKVKEAETKEKPAKKDKGSKSWSSDKKARRFDSRIDTDAGQGACGLSQGRAWY